MLEVKCPKQLPVSWLEKDGSLKGGDYFTQIQITMYLSNCMTSVLFIYTQDEWKMVRVPFNQQYV